MSIEAITWVSRQTIRPSSVKFVLFALANCANETRICFPSIEYVVGFTSQDRKTVIAAIAQLQRQGYLEDTGRRVGRTGQIKVYRLKNTDSGTVKEPSQEDQNRHGSTVPFSDSNSTVFPSKESRFSAERVPKTGHGSVREPSGNRQGTNMSPSATGGPVESIFDHWRKIHSHPKAVLDPKRRALINKWLKVYDEQQLKDSISGYANSPHHKGDNPRNTAYDTIELLLRDAGHIDAGLKFFSQPPKAAPVKEQLTAAQVAWKRVCDEAAVEQFRKPDSGESLDQYRCELKRHTDEKARSQLAQLQASMAGGVLKKMGAG